MDRHKKYKKYSKVYKRIKPLDILLFRGVDFVSRTIRFLERKELGNGDYSHVGIVVDRTILPSIEQMEPGRLYVWESTASLPLLSDGTPDVESNDWRFGVQIRDLESVVSSYTSSEGAEVAWGKLRDNPWNDTSKRPEIINTMKRIHKKYGRKLYELSLLELLASLFTCLRPVRNMFDEVLVEGHRILHTIGIGDITTRKQEEECFLFCSELVAIIYQSLGIISDDLDPSNVVPVDFLGADRDGIPRIVTDITKLKP